MYGVPTAAATRGPGVERASWVLRQEGLLDALRATGATVVNLSDLSLFAHRDDGAHPTERNAEVVSCAVQAGADEMTRALSDGFAILLGGDCTMGAAAALGVRRARGVAPGLVWLDGDGDLNTPATTPSGYIEGMALAMALGRGPQAVLGDEVATTADRVALLGWRVLDEGEKAPLQQLGLQMDLAAVQADPAGAAARALSVVTRGGAPFVIHLDVDVMSPEEMPARRGLVPGGLTRAQLSELLSRLVADPHAVALSVASYDPERDPDRVWAKALNRLLAAAVGARLSAARP